MNPPFPLLPADAFRLGCSSSSFVVAEEAFAAWLLSGDVAAAVEIAATLPADSAARGYIEVQAARQYGLLDGAGVDVLLDKLARAGMGGHVSDGWVFELDRLEQRMEDRRFIRLFAEMTRGGRRPPPYLDKADSQREFAWMDAFQREHPLPPELLGF